MSSSTITVEELEERLCSMCLPDSGSTDMECLQTILHIQSLNPGRYNKLPFQVLHDYKQMQMQKQKKTAGYPGSIVSGAAVVLDPIHRTKELQSAEISKRVPIIKATPETEDKRSFWGRVFNVSKRQPGTYGRMSRRGDFEKKYLAIVAKRRIEREKKKEQHDLNTATIVEVICFCGKKLDDCDMCSTPKAKPKQSLLALVNAKFGNKTNPY